MPRHYRDYVRELEDVSQSKVVVVMGMVPLSAYIDTCRERVCMVSRVVTGSEKP